MRSEDKEPVIAVVCSDLHLSLNPPVSRSRELNWFTSMARQLNEMKALAERHKVPILCAGDVFDHWRSPPELINFALDCLPEMYAIPGQHDLPLHDNDAIHKSAYWTMVKAGIIHNVSKPMTVMVAGPTHRFRLYGYGWARPIRPPAPEEAGFAICKVALVHEYTWIESASFPGASEESKASPKKYLGYDAVVIGDNHKSWEQVYKGTTVFNCGGFMRRRSDEVSHRPRVGLLHADGSIESHYLDTSEDVLVDTVEGLEADNPNFSAFLSELKGFQAADLDYHMALKRAAGMPNVSPAVRQLLNKALEEAR